MIYIKDGFRPFYKSFLAFMLNDRFRRQFEDLPGAVRANCMLTYGFIDHEKGFTLEVLALGERSDDGFRFFDGDDERRYFVRIDALMNEEAWWLEDPKGELRAQHEKKLAVLKAYDVPEDVEQTRGMDFIDSARNFQFVDDVLVTLVRDRFLPEPVWVRIFGLGEHWFKGRLLQEPDQDFGIRAGETVAFFLSKRADGSTECWADLNPERRLTAQDLEDGSLLRASVKFYANERTREHFADVCRLLRDSFVWVPCKKEESKPENVVPLPKGRPLPLDGEVPEDQLGKCVTDAEPERFVPELLQNGDRVYLPVFSSRAEMTGYPEEQDAVRKFFLEAMSIAVSLPVNVAGIVLNAFTDPFVLDRELFEAVARMESRVN